MTEHIASEMRLILHNDKGKAGVFYRACLDLPSAACPPPSRLPTPEWRGMGWRAPKPIRKPGAALLRALGWSDTPPILQTSEGLSSVAGSRRTR